MPLSKERAQWEQTDDIIGRWLKQRQELLGLFQKLANVDPFKREPSKKPSVAERQKMLAKFCEILIDYTAVGHFQVFEKMAEGIESKNPGSGLDGKCFDRIQASTDRILDFNDRYSNSKKKPVELKKNLSSLIEVLGDRFDREDECIRRYLKATATLKAQRKSKSEDRPKPSGPKDSPHKPKRPKF